MQIQNISVYAIFNDQSFNDTLTNDAVNFEQLGRDVFNLQHIFIKKSGAYLSAYHSYSELYKMKFNTKISEKQCTGINSSVLLLMLLNNFP